MPWDSGTSYRPGPRFGPEAVRSASALLRPYNPAQDVMVWGALSCVDYGDAPTVPGYIEDTLARIQAYAESIHRGGAIPLGIGGDHSVTLAELRAAAAVHGRLGLLLRAALQPRHRLQAGLRGGPARPAALRAGGHARLALRARRLPGVARSGHDDPALARVARARPCRVCRPRAPARRLGPRLFHVRRRLRRPGLLPGHRDAGGGRPHLGRGDRLCASPARAGLPGLRRGGGRPAVRRARSGDGAARLQRGLRDALAGRARARLNGKQPPGQPPHAEREQVADQQVGHVVLPEVDDRELLQG